MLTRVMQTLIAVALVSSISYGSDETTEFHIRSDRELFSDTSMGTRAKGMGKSYTAVAGGAAGVIENPASLGAMTYREAIVEMGFDQIDAGTGEADIFTVNVGGAVNLNACAPEYWPRDNMGNHTVGMVIHHKGMDYTSAQDLDTNLTGFVLAYGRSFRGGEHFGGISLRYSEGGYDNPDLSTNSDLARWEFKVGGITRPVENLALGMTFSYGRGSITDEGTSDDNAAISHFEFRVGAAYQLTDDVLLVTDLSREDLDIEYSKDTLYDEHNIWRLSGGLEKIMIPERLTLRGGMYILHDDFTTKGTSYANQIDDFVGITTGGTYYRDALDFSWSLDLRTSGEWGNFFKIGYNW
ncbi:MAG: hypothetical protein JXR97_15285 [Planctomycetes bacterium]|nr:hypothetical protein [Planctomycetota bacterium]